MATTLAGDSLRIIRLVELQLEQATYRYAFGPNDVTWSSLTWTATAGAHTDAQESAQREAPTLRLSMQNLDGVLGKLVDPLVGGKDPRGRRVVIREVTEADIADASSVRSTTYVIDSVQCGRTAVVFQLGSPYALVVMVPSRTVGSVRCQWVYRDRYCGSTSTLKECGKTLADCKMRFGTGEALRFSPGLARTRSRRVFFV
jgi:phage-related protein